MGKFAEHNVAMGAVFDQDASYVDLQAIAEEQPGLRHLVAGHRNTSPATLAWLAQLGDPNIARVLESRGVAVPAAPSQVSAPSRYHGNFMPAVIGAVAVVVVVALVVAGLRFFSGASQSPQSTSPSPTDTGPIPADTGSYPRLEVPIVTLVGGDGYDVFYGVAVTADGGIVAVGSTDSRGGTFKTHLESAAVVVMFDGGGNVSWARTMKLDVESFFKAVAIGADGSIYAVGTVYMPEGDPQCRSHGLAVKLTPSGDVVWHETYRDGCNDYFEDVVASDEGVIVVGFSELLGDESRSLITSISADGDLVWSKTYGDNRVELLYSATLGLDGTIVAVGHSDSRESADDASNAGLIAGFSPNGDRLWTREIRGSGWDIFKSVSTAPDNTFFVVGRTTSRDGDLPFASAPGNYVPVYGVFTVTGSPVSFNADASQAKEFNGSTVTSDGLAVAVGGENLLVGVLTMRDGSYANTEVASVGRAFGEFFATAALVGDRVVAVGCGYEEATPEAAEDGCYAAMVIFSVP